MKNFTIGLLGLTLILIFSGCEKYGDKRFSTTLELSFLIDLTDTDPTVFNLDSTVTSLTNAELKKFKENIKYYELKSIKYKVYEFWTDQEGEDVQFNGEVGFGNLNSTSPGVLHTFSDISLKSGNDNPAKVQIPFNSQDIKKIEQYFLDTNGLKLYVDGNTSSTPVHFYLQFQVNIDAIANVKKK
ncbi:MAG: hypothetical protein IT223_12880 [Crocinitomicaceae bacterium]|nr:hypothetical protein [Crocinitomicaceae bacterium]